MVVAERLMGFGGVCYRGISRCGRDEVLEEVEGEDVHYVKEPLVD